MTAQNDGGIVKYYVEQFLALGVESHTGRDVSPELEELVQKAFEHLNIWADGTPADNKRRLVSQLKLQAELVEQSTPAQAKVLMDAHALASSKLF